MEYAFCEKSGLQLPRILLGLWHNFDYADDFEEARFSYPHRRDDAGADRQMPELK